MNATKTPTIAIDAMGGDIGLDTTLAAIVQSQQQQLNFIIVGDEAAIKAHKFYAQIDKNRSSIHHSSQIVGMDEAPSSVLRHKQDSSLWQSITLVNKGCADAVVSAGNTGALMASARYILKMLPGISRPAICTRVPSNGGHVHWLDLGANTESKPIHLLQFALMGAELAKSVDNNQHPKIGLLNVGAEDIKGNGMVKEAGKLLENSELNYTGFIEGDDIFLKEDLDVVVCDGFVGNIALKAVEGISKFIQRQAEIEFKRSKLAKLSALLSYPTLKRLKKNIDPRNYNGATLLGLQGIVIKSHGNSDGYAFSKAIETAHLEIANNVLIHIGNHLIQSKLDDK